MHLEYFDIICIISIFQLLLFSFFLISSKKGRRLSNRILALFLISQAMGILDILCFHLFQYTYHYFPHLFYIGYPFRFLWVPTIYLYTKSLTDNDFALNRLHLFHLLPFLIFMIYLTMAFHIQSADMKREILSRSDSLMRVRRIGVTFILHIQIMGYIIASLHHLRQYRMRIRMIFSSLTRINLSWLNLILHGYIIAWASSLIVNLNELITGNYANYYREINISAFFIFFNIIFYKGLTQPEIFMSQDEKSVYQKSRQPALSAPKVESILKRVLEFMDKEKPYLDSELTLKDLAERISVSPRNLSFAINDRLKQNFFDFVNRYRVEEAKRLLAKPESQRFTILGIAFDAGFNSKSSFNLVFKKIAKMTPSQFQESIQSQTKQK